MKLSQRLAVNLASGAALGVMVLGMAWAAEESRMEKYLREARTKRENDLANLDGRIDHWTKQKKLIEKSPIRAGVSKEAKDGKPGIYPSKDKKAAHLLYVQGLLDDWAKQRERLVDESLPDPSITSLRVGQFGRLPAFEVTQVIDGDSMLIEVERLGAAILHGVSTDGIADGKRLFSNKFYDVTGTESFTTVLGAKRTVYVVRPFDEKKKGE